MNFQKFKEKYQHKEVTEFPNHMVNDPVVSVCVITYNHVNYIKECLDGILMQRTGFSFEILLGDDASSDGTREICLEYAERYPDKMRFFLHHRENNIRISGNFTGRFNFLYNLYAAKGKYIALCEGDDYWTDPYKLQRQVDFLEEHQDYGLVFTDADILNQSTGELIRNYNKTFKRRIPTGDVLKILGEKNLYRSCTSMFLLELLDDYLSFIPIHNLRVGDVPLWMHIASKMKVGYIKESTTVYRVLEASASNFTTLAQCIRFEKDKYKMRLHLASLYNLSFDKKEQKKKVQRNIIRYSITKNQYSGSVPLRNIGMVFSLFIKEKFLKPIIKLIPLSH